MKRLRGRFGDATCEIHASTTTAIPYLVDERRHVLTWFPDSNARQVEFRTEGQVTALSAAILYLEAHVGAQNSRLMPAADSLRIEAPRIPPATISS